MSTERLENPATITVLIAVNNATSTASAKVPEIHNADERKRNNTVLSPTGLKHSPL